MTDFLKQDIFFFVTTVVTIVVGILLAILMVYIIKIARDIKYITSRAKEEADLISEDLSELRQNVREKGAKMKYFLSFFNNLGKKKVPRSGIPLRGKR